MIVVNCIIDFRFNNNSFAINNTNVERYKNIVTLPDENVLKMENSCGNRTLQYKFRQNLL